MLTVSTPAPSTLSPVFPGGYTPRERFIRLPEVLYTTGLSRSTVYEMMGRKQFPVQVSLGGKNVAWLVSEVEHWMDERIANRHQGSAE
ncbi:helix-turn-helix transcriptional regulator [Serratia marcescens]|uniref:Predicted transcriptional regulator n=1 Tax=Serratia marcescens TaxID=615 RepID=A0A379Y064_SERMA|nr:AlpA family transcriptional regulator [Serratia marcescens]KFD16699.1 putative prophage regulatory protein [Serratia marcescens subsp. marcescens ATCC 13880]KFL05854.1 prophage CP4-57 regulatory family protein [Serratia marcescens]MCC3252023.1 AlpA family transcriptional regulator [Serratia marcescens]PNU42435.1 AlpA family transcriptional regulator [Serratia marcescens subsp. marcescens ATCC 13880]QDL84714.1 AlpA family transcriptional regulator [Serratia marcescens subsp. marcescens ATCC 